MDDTTRDRKYDEELTASLFEDYEVLRAVRGCDLRYQSEFAVALSQIWWERHWGDDPRPWLGSATLNIAVEYRPGDYQSALDRVEAKHQA